MLGWLILLFKPSEASTLAIPVYVNQYRQRHTMQFLRTGTATRVTVGPFIDNNDGVTPKTALDVTACKLTLVVDHDNASTLVLDVNPTAGGGDNDLIHVEDDDAGFYTLDMTAENLNYLGRATLAITNAASHCPVFCTFMLLPAAVYDAIVSGTGALDAHTVSYATGMSPAEQILLDPDTRLSVNSDGSIPTTLIASALDVIAVATGISERYTDSDGNPVTTINMRQAIAVLLAVLAGDRDGVGTRTTVGSIPGAEASVSAERGSRSTIRTTVVVPK